MSHGSTDKCEPNFTPLLDLVLQLVMFFMLCANFVMEQTSAEVKLPEAHAAKPIDKDATDPIFLNVNPKGIVLPPLPSGGTDPLENAIQVESELKRSAKVELARTKKEKPETIIILRVDKETPFDKTYAIMKACRQAGYSRVQLRAIRAGGKD